MKPYKYTDRDGNIKFSYYYSDLKKFIQRGKEFGDCGLILIARNKQFDIFKGFGTIENPHKELVTISIAHNPIFFGENRTPDQIITPTTKEIPPLERYKMYFIDTDEYNGKPNIQQV